MSEKVVDLSILSSFCIHSPLLQPNQTVYVRGRKTVKDREARDALTRFIEENGRGPFRVIGTRGASDSGTVPQCVTIARRGETLPIQAETGPLWLSRHCFR